MEISNRGQIEEKNIQKSEEIPRNDDTTEKMFIIVHTVPVLASNDLVLDLFSIHHGLQMCVGPTSLPVGSRSSHNVPAVAQDIYI